MILIVVVQMSGCSYKTIPSTITEATNKGNVKVLDRQNGEIFFDNILYVDSLGYLGVKSNLRIPIDSTADYRYYLDKRRSASEVWLVHCDNSVYHGILYKVSDSTITLISSSSLSKPPKYLDGYEYCKYPVVRELQELRSRAIAART